jgi:hypothetical protein
MVTSSAVIQTLDDLRAYVKNILCLENQLEIDAFPLTERILTRSDRPCGIFFCLHGPRAVKLSAIWESERNTVLFYGQTGERFQRTQLAQAPEWEEVFA